MTSLASYNKSQLIELISGYRTQIDDLTQANELLSSAVEDAATDTDVPAEMMVTGLLKQVIPATRKDGSVVEGFFKYAIELSVGYNTGEVADGKAVWDNVYAYKTLWFCCDAAMASTLTELIEANEWTLVRSWYKYGTRAANVASNRVIGEDGQPVVNDNGEPVFNKRLRHAADLRGRQVDVIKFKAKADDDANTADIDDNDV